MAVLAAVGSTLAKHDGDRQQSLELTQINYEKLLTKPTRGAGHGATVAGLTHGRDV